MVDNLGPFPVLALITQRDGVKTAYPFRANGGVSWSTLEHPTDLVLKPKVYKLDVWINVVVNNTTGVVMVSNHVSEQAAINHFNNTQIRTSTLLERYHEERDYEVTS